MTDLSALIERLEQATEGSRELDAAIAVATFATVYTGEDLIYARGTRRDDGCAPGTFWRKSRSGASLQTAPHYSTSLDAALTLVPEGWEWQIESNGAIPLASIGPINAADTAGCVTGSSSGGSPALALATAALKARSAS